MPLLDNQTLDRRIVQRTADRAIVAGDAVAELLRRAELLCERDRSLVQLAVGHGVTHRHIARLVGLSAGQVGRRLRRIGQRLSDPLVVRLLSPVCPLRPEYRQVGLEHFLQKTSFRRIAHRHAMPLSQVRRICQDLRAWEGRRLCAGSLVRSISSGPPRRRIGQLV